MSPTTAPSDDPTAPSGDTAAPSGDTAAPSGDTAAPSGDTAAPSGDTDISDPAVVFDKLSIEDVLDRIHIYPEAIAAFIECQHAKFTMVNSIYFSTQFNLIWLKEHPEWDNIYGTTDLKILAAWFKTHNSYYRGLFQLGYHAPV